MERLTPRVTFGRAERLDGNPRYLNARVVRLDGQTVGVLYGRDPSPHNPLRPTGFVLVVKGEEIATYTRIEEAREFIARIVERAR